MRTLLTLLTAAALLATPAFAEARGFKSDLGAAIQGPLKLDIVVSEDLAHRANNLPKKRSERSSSTHIRSSFANNGRYGDRAIEHLIREMQDELTHDFAKRNIYLSDTAPTRLRVTIEKAKPNRPTFNQLRVDPSLSFQSFGVGGAKISVEIVAAGGEVLGNASYDYFGTIDDHRFGGSGVWSDANRAISRFSNHLSKQLASINES